MSATVMPFDRRSAPAERALPANIDAEQAFLGCLLMANEVFSHVAGFLKAEHFSEEIHRRAYQVAAALIADSKVASPITLRTFLGADEVADGVTVPAYLARIVSDACAPIVARDYALTIRDLFIRREIIAAADEAKDQAFDAPVDMRPAAIAGAVLERLAELTEDPATVKRASIGDSVGRLMNEVYAIRDGSATSSGVSTGFPDLDRDTGGYRPGELWILGARSGTGKTVFAVTSATKVARKDHSALVFSLEVPEKQFTARVLADLAYTRRHPIPFKAIMNGKVEDDELWQLEDAQRRLRVMPLVVDYSSKVTIIELRARIHSERKRMEAKGTPLAVVFIDYLKMIAASERYRGNRVYEIGEISGALKQIAKDEGVCIVLLAQLNRALEAREDKRPTVADLRDSSDLENDADVVAFLYREAVYIERTPAFRGGEIPDGYEETKHRAELILGKNRSGPTGMIKLFCDVSCSTMAAVATGYGE